MEEFFLTVYERLGPIGTIIFSLIIFFVGTKWDQVWAAISPYLMKRVENEQEQSDFERQQRMLELQAESTEDRDWETKI